MASTYDNDLKKVFSLEIRRGAIAVDASSDAYFEKLASVFPVCGSKIDWEEVPGSIGEVVVERANEAREFAKFFETMMTKNRIHDEIIYIGDGLTDTAYIGLYEAMKPHLSELFSIPQHHYFIAKDFSWCMVFSFEGSMDFGKAVR